MERFFLNLKMERVWRQDYVNHSEAIHDVTDHIVGFYNSQRLLPHWAIGLPMPLNGKWPHHNLLLCLKKLDHYR